MPYRDLSDGQILAAASGFAAICGWLSYLLKVQEGKAFLWREFFLHGAISAVCGLISYEILAYEGFPPQLCGALSGLAGWGGTRAIRLAWLLITKRLGVSKEDLK
mgnify:FL=1